MPRLRTRFAERYFWQSTATEHGHAFVELDLTGPCGAFARVEFLAPILAHARHALLRRDVLLVGPNVFAALLLRAVRRLLGVKGVTNLIQVKPKLSPSNIKGKIEEALTRSVKADVQNIQIEVNGSNRRLEGQRAPGGS